MREGRTYEKRNPRISTRIHWKIKIIACERGQGRGETGRDAVSRQPV